MPFIDEVTVAFALEGVSALGLGKGPAPDLLAISLSGTDAVHHRLGPDSREAHDQLLRTDRLVGQLLDSLYRLRDPSRVVVVFSADHGFSTIPELAAAGENPNATRATLDDALAVARAKMTALGVDSLAIDVDQQIVLMDRRAFQRTRANPDTVLDTFIASARRTPGIKRIDKFAALLSADTLTDPVARRWSHQFIKGTNVELVATLEPGSLWTTLLVASHGSPYDYDSHVPIIFFGAGFKPGQHPEFVRTVDIGPTLARILGVKPTERLDGVPLVKALH
jgi:predicted AlkP superfamily pyrophosphatase or phosphodiesterase